MLKQIFLISLIVFGSVFLIFYLFQRQLIYFPDKQKPVLSEYQAQDMTEISISTSDQIKLNAWYKSALNNKPTLLYLHGNGLPYSIFMVMQDILVIACLQSEPSSIWEWGCFC